MATQLKRAALRGLQSLLRRRGYVVTTAQELQDLREADETVRVKDDVSVPLPPGAEEYLRPDNPRLLELRRAYEDLDWPSTVQGRWKGEILDPVWLDLRFFRGDTPYMWHYRESERVSQLKFFVFLRYVMERDPRGLIQSLGEDGMFGCWVHRFDGYPPCSRDLLDSVSELAFLERRIQLFDRAELRILDIGAGYGRLAHRAAQALPNLKRYTCVDAVPESTFLSEYYTRFRSITPPVEVVPLHDVPSLAPGSFDLVCNIHSFSEMPLAAIEWWLSQIERLQPQQFFLLPNEPPGVFLSTEADGSRKDYGGAIEAAGFELTAEEHVFDDPAVRQLMRIDDRYCLFERRPANRAGV